jgi:peptidoglycan/xylan/chitin deacetylase (PgdA/CDA1 family)
VVPVPVGAADWEPGRTAESLARDVLAGVAATGHGAVVLLHTWPARTLEALPAILDSLRANGTEVVTVDALAERDLGTTANPKTQVEDP